MENENELGLSEDDLANVRQVMNELIDVVAKFNGLEEITEADYANLKTVIDFANFIVSGIIYANAIDLCANHEHHDDDDDEDGVE